jgi:oligosaccharide amylase
LRTSLNASSLDLSLVITDVVAADRNVLYRSVRVERSQPKPGTTLIHYGQWNVDESSLGNTVFFDNASDSVITYKRGTYLAIASTEPLKGYACGVADTPKPLMGLWGERICQGEVSSLSSWDAGGSEGAAKITLIYTAGASLTDVRANIAWARDNGSQAAAAVVSKLNQEALRSARPLKSAPPAIESLYRRSLLTLATLRDLAGGFIAAPEFDRQFTNCGGYGYCWGRDAAYITFALDEAGVGPASRDFYLKWAIKAQSADGGFWHRHYVDGLLAPSWGSIQIDESASIVWGAWRHAQDDEPFKREFRGCALRATRFLLGFVEANLPSTDLWEERLGQHAYSLGAVAAGLVAGSSWARLAEEYDLAAKCEQVAAELRSRLLSSFWSEKRQTLIRTLNMSVSADQLKELGDPVDGAVNLDEKGYARYTLPRNEVVDASLLGLLYPFEVFSPSENKMVKTTDAVEGLLTNGKTGGVKRYEGDLYAGGNPWVLCTCWLGLVRLKLGDRAKAQEALDWAANHATELGLLPEQVDRITGEPAWVIPLAWSHAMFILLALELYS